MERETDAPRARSRIGIFGGSFDPPHNGHVSAARDVADRLGLEEVLWIPAARSPHKLRRPLAPDASRLAMVRAAVGADPRFRVHDIEIRRGGASYTVDTLRALVGDGPASAADVFLILGVDQFATFADWREPKGIRELVTLAVMDREGTTVDPVRTDIGTVRVPVRRIDVSSTDVRDRVARGEDIADLVPGSVRDIIERDRLYEA